MIGGRRQIAEKRNLARRAIAMGGGGGGQRFLDAGEKFGAIASEKIKGAGLDQAFDDLAIGQAGIQPAAKILQGSEVPSPLPLRDRRGHRAFADVLDRGEAITDGAASLVRRAQASSATGVNFSPLRFMSGGRIGIPIRLHSPTKTEILSVLLISLLNNPAMNSTG